MVQRNRLDLPAGPSAGETKVVKKVAPLEVFLVEYVDGEGKEETRVLARPKGGKDFVFLFPAGSEKSMRPASTWFQDQIKAQVDGAPINEEELPETGNDVPVGDPLGEAAG